jgi:hypothetical protein
MTTKHNAKTARDHLFVAKQRAASAMSASQKRNVEARQRDLMERTRVARALEQAKRAERAALAAAAKEAPEPAVSATDAVPTQT